MLKYVISHGIVDVNAVRDNMLKEKKQYYLSMHKYKIFQDKDGRWKTTLPDETKKSKRRLIAKGKINDLEDIIADYYKELESKKITESSYNRKLTKNMTLEDVYPIWLQSRILESTNIRTVKRNDQEWKRYYCGTPIIKVPMQNLSINDLKDWAHEMIDTYKFNKRDYYDMTLIIKKCYEYMSDENLCDNIWEKAKSKVNISKLKRMIKSNNDTEIFFSDEKQKLIDYSLRMFANRPWNISSIALPFIFVTGLRIGEVVALKYCDLDEYEITISRQEVNKYEYDKDNNKFVYGGKEVVNYTKTEAGERKIPYTKSARQLIAMIKESSDYYGYYDNDYIFCPRSTRITSNSIDKKISNYCDSIGIPQKSAHKIRKTYISQIINECVDLDTVCKVSGHTDLKTTMQSYYFCLERKEEIYNRFDDIFQNVV